jgi:hypothetical protein
MGDSSGLKEVLHALHDFGREAGVKHGPIVATKDAKKRCVSSETLRFFFE